MECVGIELSLIGLVNYATDIETGLIGYLTRSLNFIYRSKTKKK